MAYRNPSNPGAAFAASLASGLGSAISNRRNENRATLRQDQLMATQRQNQLSDVEAQRKFQMDQQGRVMGAQKMDAAKGLWNSILQGFGADKEMDPTKRQTKMRTAEDYFKKNFPSEYAMVLNRQPSTSVTPPASGAVGSPGLFGRTTPGQLSGAESAAGAAAAGAGLGLYAGGPVGAGLGFLAGGAAGIMKPKIQEGMSEIKSIIEPPQYGPAITSSLEKNLLLDPSNRAKWLEGKGLGLGKIKKLPKKPRIKKAI